MIDRGRLWVQERLRPALAKRIAERVGLMGPCSLEIDPDAEDGQCLLFRYPGVFRETEAGYVRPVVKLELGARSDDWPSEPRQLVHEETFRPADKPRKVRMARHYYDPWCLISKGIAVRAVTDRALFDRVAEHRRVFFNWSWVDYGTLRPGSLRLLPTEEHTAFWRDDYRAMTGAMFFGDIPSFEDILRVVGDFERRFNEHS